MSTPRKNPASRDMSQITDDPEMLATLGQKSTLGAQASPVRKMSEKDALMAQWTRVDASRAKRGLPPLPKPGTPAYRR